MKKVILSVAVIAAIGLFSCKNEAKKAEDATQTEISNEVGMIETSFGVRGNCSMCKKTIETAANSVDGVTQAVWDVNKKTIDVTLDKAKTSALKVEQAIANSGYDTENVAGNLDAYNKLPGCCQYDHDMQMNQSGEHKANDHHGEHHM
ncbi:heavy-metal-associated domain-containing protein [Aestuariibaculum sediminum]|uniref:Cation transporter n=1 Tax=Aestuariibaculum sediminum TaxID=2770637 RepID=A0A8J6Q293_9FLAO|nr:heavy-metal-associated domain-containing protein [Aestuariibaculum sediminum]MBD0833437.1 cation transporter [Aestuariibaculum sediminum]